MVELAEAIQQASDAAQRAHWPNPGWKVAQENISAARTRYRSLQLNNIELKRRLHSIGNTWQLNLYRPLDNAALRDFWPLEHYADVDVKSDEVAKEQTHLWAERVRELAAVNETIADALMFLEADVGYRNSLLIERLLARTEQLEEQVNGLTAKYQFPMSPQPID